MSDIDSEKRPSGAQDASTGHEVRGDDAASGGADTGRRGFLKKAALGSAGGAAVMGMPYIGNAEAREGVRIRMQSSWQPGTVGFQTFENWASRVQELTSGEVRVEPFAAGSVVGDFDLVDGVRDGVIEGQNMFTVYWAGRMPAGVFFSS